MGKYFSIDELCASAAARKHGIANIPPEEAVTKMELLIERLLDPIREGWGKAITVNSGYRSPELNRIVGGVARSQHLRGEAADLTTGSRDENRKLFRHILESGLEFDQLINECNYAWIHVSYGTPNRRQIIGA